MIRLLLAILLSLWPLTGLAAAGERIADPSAAEPPRLLLIAIDAVPLDIMQKVAADPDNEVLHGLPTPVPLISTFPSTTSLALAAIQKPLGVEESPGYENRFYDWQTNKVVGGGLMSYEPFPWRKSFDWKVEGLRRKAMSALRPIKASHKDIEQSLAAFLESDQSAFFIYYDTTDSASHLKGPEGLIPILEDLDRQLGDFRRAHPEVEFDLVLFSDHGIDGGDPLINVRKPVTKSLKKAGYKRRKKLIDERDYVITPFGLVSSFVVFAQAGQERPIARVIANVEEVSICSYREGDGWAVVDLEGRASFEKRGTTRPEWRYTFEGEDPLEIAELWEEAGTDGWLSDRSLLRETEAAAFPDPLYRISEAFTLVENPASIICSTTGDGVYGSKSTSFGARLSGGRLRWTHGALHREATLGFFVTDIPGLQPQNAVRFDEALLPFADRFDHDWSQEDGE